MSVMLQAAEVFKDKMCKAADEIAKRVGNAGLCGEKLPYGYSAIEVSGGYVLTKGGKAFDPDVIGSDACHQFHKDLGRGLSGKVGGFIQQKAEGLQNADVSGMLEEKAVG